MLTRGTGYRAFRRGVLATLGLAACAVGARQSPPPSDGGTIAADAAGAEITPPAGQTSDATGPVEAAFPPGILAGAATEDITPPWPTYEESYDVLVSNHYRKVEVKALAITDQTTPIVILTADICDFCTEISQPVYDGVKALGLLPEQIILNSSHIHSAPAACAVDVLDVKQHPIDRYQKFLVQKLISVIGKAMKSMVPAVLGTSESTCDICVNRNPPPHTAGDIKPNPPGPRDRRVRVLQVKDPQSGKLKAALALFGCHPSDIGPNSDGSNPGFGGDYFGFGRDEVERDYPDVVVLTAQGMGGDVRLNTVDPKNPTVFTWLQADENMARNKENGRQFGRAIIEALGKPETPVMGRIVAGVTSVMLPEEPPDSQALAQRMADGLEGPPLRPKMIGDWTKRYGKWLLAKYESGSIPSPNGVGPYSMRIMNIGDDFALAGIDGETFTCIGRQIEEALAPRKTYVLGYSNDVSAYIMCGENITTGEGGYEVNVYYWWLWQTARFKPTVDQLIVQGALDLSRRLQGR